MNAFWGLGQLMFSKTIVVVDKDVNVQDVSEVAWIVGTHMDPLRDIQMTRGPVDDLDDAADLPAYGGKMGIDATRKWASEGYTRTWPARVEDDRGGGAPRRGDLGARSEARPEATEISPSCRRSKPLAYSSDMSTVAATNSFLQRLIGAAALDAAIYEEVES